MKYTVIILLLIAGLVFVSGCTDKSAGNMPVETDAVQTEEISGDSGTQDSEQSSYSDEQTSLNGTDKFPHIVPSDVSGAQTVKRSFTTKFQTHEYTIDVDISMPILNGARAAEKSIYDAIAKESKEVQKEFYTACFEDEYEAQVIDEVTKKLNHIRLANGFSDEEYFEFIIAFVQQIPYSNDPGYRLPVEVLYDQKGDCDEKSMLLISLLERNEFDTAMLLFPTLGHAVAGIRITPQGDISFTVYRSDDGRKYLYLESTAPYYIGLYPDSFASAECIAIPIGNGTKKYTKYNYVAYILDSREKIIKRIDYLRDKLNEWHDDIDDLIYRLERPNEHYNSHSDYDREYTRYRSLMEQWQDYYDFYTQNVEVLEYINSRPYDIDGVRRHIYNSKVNERDY